MIKGFRDFEQKLNEAKLVVKRRYTTSDPKNIYEEETVSPRGPVRNKVLQFINSKNKVSEKEMHEFFDSLQETYGKIPKWNWLKRNENLVDKEIDEDGNIFYSLTKRGERVLNKRTEYEKK